MELQIHLSEKAATTAVSTKLYQVSRKLETEGQLKSTCCEEFCPKKNFSERNFSNNEAKEVFAMMYIPVLFNTIATGCVWLLSMCNMANETEQQGF